MDFKQTREHALEMYKEAVEAANPKKCVLDHVRLMGSTLMVDSAKYDLDEHESIYVIAFGKAASSMAEAIEEVLGDRLTGGLVVSNTQPENPCNKLGFYRSSQPIPDGRSVNAAREVVAILENAGEKDLVLFLISGGGSALLALPVPGISIEDKEKATVTLLRS